MVLVGYLNRLIDDGVEMNRASEEGAPLHLRLVLMTALTTALGFVPLLYSRASARRFNGPWRPWWSTASIRRRSPRC